MKKYLLVLVLSLLTAVVSLAQENKEVVFKTNLTYAYAVDTVTNAGVKTQSSGSVPGFWNLVSVSATIVKISGTVAGSVVLLGSNDGVYFDTIETKTATDVATQVLNFTVTSYPWKYLAVRHTGTGTMSSKISTKAYYKRSN